MALARSSVRRVAKALCIVMTYLCGMWCLSVQSESIQESRDLGLYSQEGGKTSTTFWALGRFSDKGHDVGHSTSTSRHETELAPCSFFS